MDAAAGLVEFVHVEGEGSKAQVNQFLLKGWVGLTDDCFVYDYAITGEALGLVARERDQYRKTRL